MKQEPFVNGEDPTAFHREDPKHCAINSKVHIGSESGQIASQSKVVISHQQPDTSSASLTFLNRLIFSKLPTFSESQSVTHSSSFSRMEGNLPAEVVKLSVENILARSIVFFPFSFSVKFSL
jgi:hypothetical protein